MHTVHKVVSGLSGNETAAWAVLRNKSEKVAEFDDVQKACAYVERANKRDKAQTVWTRTVTNQRIGYLVDAGFAADRAERMAAMPFDQFCLSVQNKLANVIVDGARVTPLSIDSLINNTDNAHAKLVLESVAQDARDTEYEAAILKLRGLSNDGETPFENMCDELANHYVDLLLAKEAEQRETEKRDALLVRETLNVLAQNGAESLTDFVLTIRDNAALAKLGVTNAHAITLTIDAISDELTDACEWFNSLTKDQAIYFYTQRAIRNPRLPKLFDSIDTLVKNWNSLVIESKCMLSLGLIK